MSIQVFCPCFNQVVVFLLLSCMSCLYKRACRWPEAYEKMLNISNHQGNANQNHSEVSPHTSQNGYYQKP